MGVAGEIGEHRLGSLEGRLGVDEPVLRPERREMLKEGLATATQAFEVAEEPAGLPRRHRKARPGRAGGTGERAPAPVRGRRVCTAPSARRQAISRHPARSCGHADGGTYSHNTLSADADNTAVQVFYPFHPPQGGCAEDQLALFIEKAGDYNARHHE